MLITELRDAYREANKTFESFQLERMKDEVRIYISFLNQSECKARKHEYIIISTQ